MSTNLHKAFIRHLSLLPHFWPLRCVVLAASKLILILLSSTLMSETVSRTLWQVDSMT